MVVGSCVVSIHFFLLHSTELRVYNNAKIDCDHGRYVQKINTVTGFWWHENHIFKSQSLPIQQARNKWSLNASMASRFSGVQYAVSAVVGRSDGITNGATSIMIMPIKLDSNVISIRSGII